MGDYLKNSDVQNVLVVGIDIVALALSARRAGYNVFGVDFFGDLDLREACEDNLSIVAQEAGESCGRIDRDYSPSRLLGLVKKLLAKHRIDAAMFASGLEDSPWVLAELNELVPIIGNNPRTIGRVRDKTEFFNDLKRLGISCPETVRAKDLEEGKRVAKDIGYPVVVKPLTGMGGAGVREAEDKKQLEEAFEQASSSSEGVLVQEFVPGVHASVSFLSTGEASQVLTLNEQLLGIREVGQKWKFGYCGNVVPASASTALEDACRDLVQKIASSFNLVGSNGVDLVISEDRILHVVEVNPRFQGSMECVERFLGLNLVKVHVNACTDGVLSPFNERRSTNPFARLVLYALHRSIAPNLSDVAGVRDMPLPGVIVEEGEPLCSVVVGGKTRSSALKKCKRLAQRIYARTKLL